MEGPLQWHIFFVKIIYIYFALNKCRKQSYDIGNSEGLDGLLVKRRMLELKWVIKNRSFAELYEMPYTKYSKWSKRKQEVKQRWNICLSLAVMVTKKEQNSGTLGKKKGVQSIIKPTSLKEQDYFLAGIPVLPECVFIRTERGRLHTLQTHSELWA